LSPYLVIVRSSLPVNSLKDLVGYAKANPGKINYGSNGIGAMPHLSSELFKRLAKIDIVNVSYKGSGQMLIGLMSGEVDMLVMGATGAAPQIQAGNVRALAMLTKERLPSLPNVPTSKEAGIDNWETTVWYGILAPTGTPRDIVNRLNAEWISSAATSDTEKQLQNAQFKMLSCTPEQFSEFIKAENVRWAKVIKEANISVEN
jgi:tripartite-type tricarboxylate transporter receptor subunit TctC